MEKAVLCLVALVLVGCAHTNILPYANGDFLMVATSANESVAYDEAIKQSQQYCYSQNRRFALVQHHTQYQGMDKTARGVIGALDLLTSGARRPYGYGMSTASSNDYKVEMTFRCL